MRAVPNGSGTTCKGIYHIFGFLVEFFSRSVLVCYESLIRLKGKLKSIWFSFGFFKRGNRSWPISRYHSGPFQTRFHSHVLVWVWHHSDAFFCKQSFFAKSSPLSQISNLPPNMPVLFHHFSPIRSFIVILSSSVCKNHGRGTPVNFIGPLLLSFLSLIFAPLFLLLPVCNYFLKP